MRVPGIMYGAQLLALRLNLLGLSWELDMRGACSWYDTLNDCFEFEDFDLVCGVRNSGVDCLV